MIVYDLTCDNSHPFEGWFGSAGDFALQAKAGDIACPVCGSVDITRELSAPYVKTGSESIPVDVSPAISVTNAAQELKKKFIEHVLNNTENVGHRFPEEARKIFYREAPERAIRGTASGQEVSALQEEGIAVMAIPAPSLPDKLH
jgi:hypothetical protein